MGDSAGAAGHDEDRALVAGARAGDRAALESLLRRHYDRIHAVCRRLAGNEADGADATQEAMIAILRGLPRFDGAARFSTWAYRVAVNATLDEMRRRSRRSAVDLDAAPSLSVAGADAGVADRADIDAALRKLAPEFRAAVVLRDLCALDYAEIAEVLGIPPGTVRSRISRGRAMLVPLLGGGGGRAVGNPDATGARPSERP